ncbi:MAG: hypothetical protein AAF591_12855 [Verrucomicrobiota bacterium]
MKKTAPAKSPLPTTPTHTPAAPLYELTNSDSLDTLEGKQLATLWILALHDPHPCSPALAHAIGAYLESHSLHLNLDETGLSILPHAVTFTDDSHNEWQLCRLDPASSDLHFLCNDFLVQVLHFDQITDYTPRRRA